MSNFELRECATLGTFWRDIWKDGELWAMEVDAVIAQKFIDNPQWHNGNSFAPEVILRRNAIELEFGDPRHPVNDPNHSLHKS